MIFFSIWCIISAYFAEKGRLMGKKSVFLAVFFGTVLLFALAAGERTIPVDMILMIDKSLSMEDPVISTAWKGGRSMSLSAKCSQTATGSAYISFTKSRKTPLSVDIKDQSDRQKIAAAVAGIQPNGKYTDIGTALDAINTAVKGAQTDGTRFCLITDLRRRPPYLPICGKTGVFLKARILPKRG